MSERIRIPGPRAVAATLDRPDGRTDHDTDHGDGPEDDTADRDTETGRVTGGDRAVVACPPHPEFGGDRSDPRLRAVSDALAARGIACLRFDYGPWDEGVGERTDARRALAWARKTFDRVGLFGYSFGGGVAVLAGAAESVGGHPPAATAVLSPVGILGERAVALAVDDVDGPLRVVYGDRDDTVDSELVADRARACGHAVDAVPGDHFFVGSYDRVAQPVASFLADRV